MLILVYLSSVLCLLFSVLCGSIFSCRLEVEPLYELARFLGAVIPAHAGGKAAQRLFGSATTLLHQRQMHP